MSARKKSATKPTKRPKQTRAQAPKIVRRTKSLEEIQAEGHGVCLSLNEICEEFGRDYETIKKRLHEVDVRPTGTRHGHPVYRLKDLMRLERTDAQGNTDPDKMRPAEQSAYYRAQRDRMELEKDLKQLYRCEDIEAEFARVFRVVTHELETLVDELERDVQPSPMVLTRIEDKLIVLRERMYRAISEGRTAGDVNGAHPSQAQHPVASWDVGP